MRMKFGLVDVLLVIAVATLLYLRNWQAAVFLVLVLASAASRYHKSKKGEPPSDSDEFVIDDKD